jgi:hypothetical protein
MTTVYDSGTSVALTGVGFTMLGHGQGAAAVSFGALVLLLATALTAARFTKPTRER